MLPHQRGSDQRKGNSFDSIGRDILQRNASRCSHHILKFCFVSLRKRWHTFEFEMGANCFKANPEVTTGGEPGQPAGGGAARRTRSARPTTESGNEGS